MIVPQDRQSNIDIADWLIRWRLRHPEPPDRHYGLDSESPRTPNPFLPIHHPELQLLIADLDLIPTSIRPADPI